MHLPRLRDRFSGGYQNKIFSCFTWKCELMIDDADGVCDVYHRPERPEILYSETTAIDLFMPSTMIFMNVLNKRTGAVTL